MCEDPKIIVIGAGPAGLAAASTVAQYGLAVTVVDETNVPKTHSMDLPPTITLCTSTLAWGLFPDNRVALYGKEQAQSVVAPAVVVATGGHERAVAFPGWTLPGVLTVSELADLARENGRLVNQRVLIAGSGPPLLLAAAQVLEQGGVVAAVVEAQPNVARAELVREFAGSASSAGGANPEEILHQQGIPIHCQGTIQAAYGDGRVEGAIVAKLGSNGTRDRGATLDIDCDLLCVHAGFSAASELAQMVGCAVDYNVDSGGWYVHHDGEMRTSRDGVYVAGRVAGYAGSEIAAASGRLAGLTVVHDLGGISDEEFAASAAIRKAELDALRLASCQINMYSALESELSSTVTPDTILCPCEGVRAVDVDEAIGLGARTFNDVKRRTRCGMGDCQARICGPLVNAYVARQTGVSVASIGLMSARPPVRPIPLSAVAELDQRLSSA